MIKKYSWLALKITYRFFIIGSAAFFLAASAHNMLSSFFPDRGPCSRAVVVPEVRAAR